MLVGVLIVTLLLCTDGHAVSNGHSQLQAHKPASCDGDGTQHCYVLVKYIVAYLLRRACSGIDRLAMPSWSSLLSIMPTYSCSPALLADLVAAICLHLRVSRSFSWADTISPACQRTVKSDDSSTEKHKHACI